MADEPENYLDTANNPTWQGVREMQTTLEDMIEYVKLIRRGYDLSLPLELRQQAFAEASLHTRNAMVCSKPGLGKTYLGRRTLKRGRVHVPDYELNPSNAASLSHELWGLVRGHYEVAVIDDADRLMRSDSMIGMMKRGWNPEAPAINCFITERIRKNEEYRREGSEKYNPSIPPPHFEYRLATPWFANKNLTGPNNLAAHTHPDFTALIDRGLRPRWIDSTPRNVFFYTLYMIDKGGLFRDLNLSLAEAEETLATFMATSETHPNPNLRLAIELAKARKNANYKALWTRIIDDSLRVVAGEPRAISQADLKVKPDLRKAVEEGRKEAARRKEAADRALAEARAAIEHAKIEQERREAEEAERVRTETEAIADLVKPATRVCEGDVTGSAPEFVAGGDDLDGTPLTNWPESAGTEIGIKPDETAVAETVPDTAQRQAEPATDPPATLPVKTIGDISRAFYPADIDPKWNAPNLNPRRLKDAARAIDNRLMTYRLLDYEPPDKAEAAAQWLNRCPLQFSLQIGPHMTLVDIMALPDLELAVIKPKRGRPLSAETMARLSEKANQVGREKPDEG